jgi:rhodanese-related sulfurtransferase
MFQKLSALLIAGALTGGAAVALACPGNPDCPCHHKDGAKDGDKAAKADGAGGAEVKEPFAFVALDDLSKWIDAGKAKVYDANNDEVYAAGHIPGAVHVDHAKLDASVLPTDKANNLVFYCYNEQCGASHKAAAQAVDLGYKNVFVYKGGIEGWKKAGKPVETAKADPAKAAPAKG